MVIVYLQKRNGSMRPAQTRKLCSLETTLPKRSLGLTRNPHNLWVEKHQIHFIFLICLEMYWSGVGIRPSSMVGAMRVRVYIQNTRRRIRLFHRVLLHVYSEEDDGTMGQCSPEYRNVLVVTLVIDIIIWVLELRDHTLKLEVACKITVGKLVFKI